MTVQAVPIPAILSNLPLPVIGSPLFIVSNPALVVEQCKAGIVGSMPALNAVLTFDFTRLAEGARRDGTVLSSGM